MTMRSAEKAYDLRAIGTIGARTGLCAKQVLHWPDEYRRLAVAGTEAIRQHYSIYVYPGDRYRASGGPYYCGTDDQGKRIRIPMGESGVFTFRRYREHGSGLDARGRSLGLWLKAGIGD